MSTPFRTNWPLVLTLVLAGLFAAAQFGKLTLALPQLRAAYPEGGHFVPVLISIVGMVGVLLGAVAGSVVTRAGVTRALVAALFAGAGLSLLQASLPGLWLFAGLRVVEGMTHLVIVVAAPTLIAAASSDVDRPVTMGIWAAFFGIAMAILAAGLPFLLQLGGLPLVMVAHAVGMALVALLLMPLLPRNDAVEPRPVSFIEEHQLIYAIPRLLIPGAGFVWYTIIYIALLAVLPLALGLPVWVMTALPLISIIGTLIGGVVAKRIEPPQLVVIGFALTMGASGIAWLFSASLWPLFLLFFVMALIPAGSFASIPHFNDSTIDRARATGGIAQLGNVGTTLGTPIFVLAYEAVGYMAVPCLIAGFCLAGLLATRALRARIK